MVGHFVGFTGNAAIGVSWQIFLVVIVFISSLFTGMGVLVARATGRGRSRPRESHRLPGVPHGAGAVGRHPRAARVRALAAAARAGQATPQVRAEALPYLRTMFLFSIGLLMFFMLGGALRSAGDARTPLRLGAAITVLNMCLNVIFIRGAGPIPAFGTQGAAIGTVIATTLASAVAIWLMFAGKLVVHFPRSMSLRPDFTIIRALFRFGLPAGIQGVAMNIGGVMLLRFIGSLEHSAEAQAAYAVGYCRSCSR